MVIKAPNLAGLMWDPASLSTCKRRLAGKRQICQAGWFRAMTCIPCSHSIGDSQACYGRLIAADVDIRFSQPRTRKGHRTEV